VRSKYQEYGIDLDPFVIVKADAGTYGMGIMTVKDPADVRDLNRKQRNKMAVVKEGLQVTRVMVQEGIYTFECANDAFAEPVIYMIDHFVVGGFYRVHTARGQDESLNAPGMRSLPLAFEDTACCQASMRPGLRRNRFHAGLLARPHLFPTAREARQARAGAVPIGRTATRIASAKGRWRLSPRRALRWSQRAWSQRP
jgi:glutamate--cysteine ligase